MRFVFDVRVSAEVVFALLANRDAAARPDSGCNDDCGCAEYYARLADLLDHEARNGAVEAFLNADDLEFVRDFVRFEVDGVDPEVVARFLADVEAALAEVSR